MLRTSFPSRVIVTSSDGRGRLDLVDLECLLRRCTQIPVIVACPAGMGRFDAELATLAASYENLSVLRLPFNVGRGAALRAAAANATARYIAFIDIGFRPGRDVIENAFREIEASGFAAVYGARPHAQLGAADHLARFLCDDKLSDPRSPVAVFERNVLGELLQKVRLSGKGFDIDLAINLLKSKHPVGEFAIAEAGIVRRVANFSGVANFAIDLVAILAFHSPLRSLPFFEWLFARFIIPSKSQYSIAIYCWRDPLSPKAGGGEVYLLEQAKCWVNDGHRVIWVAERFPGSKAEETLDGISIVRRGRGLSVFWAVPLWHLFESKRDYDLVIDVMNGIPFMTPLYSAKPKLCLIYHLHAHHFRDELPFPLSTLAIWVETKLVPFVYRRTRFITISESTRKAMREYSISSLPIALVHSGIGIDHVAGAKAEVPTVLYLGRVRKYKRIRKLLDAFATLKAGVPDARLVIAGDGDDLAALRREAAERGIDDVEFMGRVDDATKVRLMQEAWVFAMPSAIEGWGIVVQEAAACGTPTVAYDVGGLRDCIQDRSTGFLARDDAQFADYLTRLLVDSELRAAMSANALEASKRYSWTRAATKTLDTIRLQQRWPFVFERRDGIWGMRAGRRRGLEPLTPWSVTLPSTIAR